MNPFNRNAALWIVIVLLLALLYSVFQGGTTRTAGNTIPYSEFVRAVEQRQVQDVRISGNSITGTYREPRNGVQKFATYAPSTPPDEQLMPMLLKNVDKVDGGPAEEGVNIGSIFVSWLPVLVLVGVYIFFLRQMQSGTGRAMGFGKSRARLLTEKHGRVTFEDVAGIDEAKAELEEKEESSLWTLLLGSWLPMLALVFIFFLFMRQLQSGGGKAMSFGKSKAKLLGEHQNKVTFADVAGVEEAKDEVEEIIAFLKDPKKFTKLGGRIPKGVLMMGPPGTGKTLLSRRRG